MDFHSLRHTSVTYKLKLNGGDIKAVQGDSGHSQINMVTDVYSHIIDDDRRKNAELFEQAFYSELPIFLTLKQEFPLIDLLYHQSRGVVLSTQKFIEIFKCFL